MSAFSLKQKYSSANIYKHSHWVSQPHGKKWAQGFENAFYILMKTLILRVSLETFIIATILLGKFILFNITESK